MSAEIASDYDNVVTVLGLRYRNIDPFLLLKSSMLARKYPGEVDQRFWLRMQYRQGVNEEELSRRLQSMLDKIPSGHGHGHYELVLQTNLDTVLAIAGQPGIEWIGGEVFPNA